MTTDYAGLVEQTCASLPYGDQLNCSGSEDAPNEQHFTGKIHDSESGLDYFGARYYSENDARFMSPDWSAKVEPVPYAKLGDPQSLNLYGYMLDSPLDGVDRDGHVNNEFNSLENCAGKGDPYCSPLQKDQMAAQQQNTEIAQDDASEPPDEMEERALEAQREDALKPIRPGEKVGRAACPGCVFPGQMGDLREKDAKNFLFYWSETLKKPMTLYRMWGGEAHLEGRDGTYYSVFPPEGSPDANRIQYAILPEWGNSLNNIDEVTIPAGTIVYFGPAAPQTSETGVLFPGGGLQAFVPK